MSFSQILDTIKQVILTFITLISLIFSKAPLAEAEYEAERSNELITSFAVVSDTHVETTNSDAYKTFTMLLRGMKAGADHDVAVFLGDNVMNGQAVENYLFYSAVKRIAPAKQCLVALGNHDVGNGEGDYDIFCKSFLDFNSKKLGNDIDSPYYYKVVDGSYMIFLATEDLTVHTCLIRDEQFKWLKEVLDKAQAEGAPIFIFNHHPISHVDGVDYDVFINLLGQYDNLLYITGHTHMELTEYSFRTVESINSIYLPRSTGDYYAAGFGVVIEVYDNEVLVRGRNFIEGEWAEDLVYRYPLK